jgi:hypothetical protein
MPIPPHKKQLHAESVRVQLRFEFFHALLDDRAFVLIPSHFHRLRVTVGHKHPVGISRHIKKQAPHCSFLLAYTPLDYNESAPLVPALKSSKKLCHLVIFVHPFPIFHSYRLPLYRPHRFSDDHVWQASLLQKAKHFLRENPESPRTRSTESVGNPCTITSCPLQNWSKRVAMGRRSNAGTTSR